jgi:hypothetical protein
MAVKGKKRTLRNIKKRERLWPDIKPEMIWDWKKREGFATIPRTMPYFARIMDALSRSKPVSSTYLALWCMLWDESCLVKIINAELLAKEAGFSGQRAVSTWRGRMKILEKLGFIKSKPLADEPYGFVLLVSPYYVVKNLYDTKKYTDEGWFNALWERCDVYGASDLDELYDDEEESTDE